MYMCHIASDFVTLWNKNNFYGMSQIQNWPSKNTVGVADYFRGRGKKSRQLTTFEVIKKYHKACELLFKKAFSKAFLLGNRKLENQQHTLSWDTLHDILQPTNHLLSRHISFATRVCIQRWVSLRLPENGPMSILWRIYKTKNKPPHDYETVLTWGIPYQNTFC